MARQIVNIWTQAGFVGILFSEFGILGKLKSLNKEHRDQIQACSQSKEIIDAKSRENRLIEIMEQLFDSAKSNFEQFLRSVKNPPIIQEVINKDIEFLP